MKLRVQFGGLIVNITGKNREEMVLPEGATFRELLNALADKYGEDFHKLVLTEGGQLRPLARIVVNGQDVFEIGGLDVSLDGIPQISIVIALPYIAGG